MHSKTVGLTVGTLLAAALPLAAAAELVAPAHYADELQRCVTEIRAELEAQSGNAAGDLQHTVTRVDRERLWYEFDIETAGTGAASTRSVCRADRYQARTRLTVQDQDPSVAQVARND